MVGALLNVGTGNLDTLMIAQKLAMGSKDGPGELVTTSWCILNSRSNLRNSRLSQPSLLRKETSDLLSIPDTRA